MNPYATNKLSLWPDRLADLRAGRSPKPVSVHLMPQNVCNHRCSFCSYRLPNNKNSSHFDEGKHIPIGVIPGLLDDFKELGVAGIELTGGGEPTAHPDFDQLLGHLVERDFALGLVTNGTLLHKTSILEVGRRLRWARVSIDASRPDTYATMRKCPVEHFERAWASVAMLAASRHRFHEEFQIGVGFVLCNENIGDLRGFVEMAKAAGADNVRLSSTFSDQHMRYFKDQHAVLNVSVQSDSVREEFEDENFKVHNLIPTRVLETQHPTQDYGPCYTKDLLCVVEGEGKVYTCCTFTGSDRGCYGKFHEHPRGFRGLWEDNEGLRRAWDSKKQCPVACLYRDRNLAMIDMVDHGLAPRATPAVHKEFI